MMVAALVGPAACAGSSDDGTLTGESLLAVDIPGTSGGETSVAPDGAVTKLFDVAGDWSVLGVELARIVQAEGSTITALNCVGTGNDIIANKRVDDEWLLLESGAGGRGAGIIVSRDLSQQPPGPLIVTGRCPRGLVDAAG